MPELDGWGMMRELNMDRATMDIPVVALTAHAMVGDRERAIQAGFTQAAGPGEIPESVSSPGGRRPQPARYDPGIKRPIDDRLSPVGLPGWRPMQQTSLEGENTRWDGAIPRR